MHWKGLSAAALTLVLALSGIETADAVTPNHRPDAMVRVEGRSGYLGQNMYNTTGRGQTGVRAIGARGAATFEVLVQTNGSQPDTLRLRGSRHTTRFAVQYFLGAQEVTRQVKAGSLLLGDLAPGEGRTLRVRIATRRVMAAGTSFRVDLAARSTSTGAVDVTGAVVRRPLYSDRQQRVVQQVNATRGSQGRGRLVMHRMLADKAQRWAQRLASRGGLEHSNLASGVPSNWRALAENVGYSGDLAGVHRAFLRSSGHRANILGRFSHVGTGVAQRGRSVYVVHVFMRT